MNNQTLRQISKLLVTKSMGNAAKLYKLFDLQDRYLDMENTQAALQCQNYIDILTKEKK